MTTSNRAVQRLKVKGKAKTDGVFTLSYGERLLKVPFTAETGAAEMMRMVTEAVAQSGLPWVPVSR